MKNILSCFLTLFLFFTKPGYSRPISYPGGWTIMQKNDFNRHSFHLHFSPSPKYSIGYRAEYWRSKEWQLHSTQINYLIKRINTPKSQANFYFKSGVGLAYSDYKNIESKVEPNLFSGFSFDWEDRQYFMSYSNRMNYNSSIDKFFMQSARIGFSPIPKKYGDLHTWLMLQVDNMPRSRNNLMYTPLIRIFKGDYLTEAGINNNLEFTFNFVKRF